MFKVQEIIRNSQCQRTGKIYELVLGPFEEKDKTQVFQNLFSADFNDIGELSLSFAKYHKENADIYNV